MAAAFLGSAALQGLCRGVPGGARAAVRRAAGSSVLGGKPGQAGLLGGSAFPGDVVKGVAAPRGGGLSAVLCKAG